MATGFSLHSRMNIRTIVWPIFVEQLMRMGLLTLDIFMLAQFSDDAVAAVGLTGHFIFFLIVSYMIVSSGSAILIGQHLGADSSLQAQQYAESGVLLALVLSIIIGVLFPIMSPAFIGIYQLDPAVEIFAIQYAAIIGGLSVGFSMSIMFATILRAHGFSKSPMVIQLLAGFINLVGNYIALFPPWGLPQTGLPGVAFATVISQFISAVLCWYVIKLHRIPLSFRQIFRPDFPKLKQILTLGLPNAGETLSYNLAQITIMYFIAQLGTAALAAVAIAQTLSRIIFVFAMAVGNGAQILSSYFIGQGRTQELKRNVHRYWLVGLGVSVIVTVAMIITRESISHLFSEDTLIQNLIGYLIIASLFLESGRAINLIVISALKGAGDVIFPVKVGIVSMWGIGVFLAYLFGLKWGFGVVGVWIAVGLDEWIRGIIMIVRWQNERWLGKSQVPPLVTIDVQ